MLLWRVYKDCQWSSKVELSQFVKQRLSQMFKICINWNWSKYSKSG